MQAVLAVLSGSAVGFALGLVGGGGSIPAVPLLLYVVGLPSPHRAIGTSALAVAANADVAEGQDQPMSSFVWRFLAMPFCRAVRPGSVTTR